MARGLVSCRRGWVLPRSRIGPLEGFEQGTHDGLYALTRPFWLSLGEVVGAREAAGSHGESRRERTEGDLGL